MIANIMTVIQTYKLFILLWLLFVTLLFLALLLRRKTSGHTKGIYSLIPWMLYVFMVVAVDVPNHSGGIDAYSYMKIFEWAQMPLGEYIAFRKEELGYLVLNWIIYRIVPNPWFFFAVIHSIAFWLCYKLLTDFCIRKTLMSWMMVFLYSTALFLMFNTVRMGVCVYLGLYALKACRCARYRIAVVYAILATLFHSSALMLFVTIALLYVRDHLFGEKSFHLVVAAMFFSIWLAMLLLKRNMFIAAYTPYLTFKEGNVALGSFAVVGLTTFLLGKLRYEKKYKNTFYIIETALLILPINYHFSIAYRMYLLYLPFVYEFIFTYAPEAISVRQLNYLSSRKMLTYIMVGIFVAEVFKMLFIGVPDGMNGYVLRF